MANGSTKERTVAFWEVVNADGQRQDDVDWPDLLARLSLATPAQRRFTTSSRDLYGWIYTLAETDTLVLSIVRERDNLPQRLLVDYTVSDFEMAEGEGVIESSNIAFFNPGNILGMVRGSTSGPTTSALTEWMNGLDLLEYPISIRPLVRADVQRQLADADFGRAIVVRVNSSATDALAEATPRIASLTRMAQQQFGDVIVEMTIRVPQDAGHDAESRAILEEGRRLAVAHPGVGRARLVYRSEETERRAEVDFLADRLSTKVAVEVRDVEGNPVRNVSAVEAIMTAYEEFRPELLRAVGRS